MRLTARSLQRQLVFARDCLVKIEDDGLRAAFEARVRALDKELSVWARKGKSHRRARNYAIVVRRAAQEGGGCSEKAQAALLREELCVFKQRCRLPAAARTARRGPRPSPRRSRGSTECPISFEWPSGDDGARIDRAHTAPHQSRQYNNTSQRDEPTSKSRAPRGDAR